MLSDRLTAIRASARQLRMLLAPALCLLVLVVSPAAFGQAPDPSMATGTSSRTARTDAAARIPYDQLHPEMARKIRDVVGTATLYRQLPVTTIQSDPDLYLTLLRYPEVIISTWQLMGVTQMTAQRVGPFSMKVADGAGTTTRTDLVYGDPNLNVFYSEGEYDGPMLFRKVTGSCVIIIESAYHAGDDGSPVVTSRLNIFLKIDNMAAGLFAKTIHPLVGTTADNNFVETLRFAEKLAKTTATNGPGVQNMSERLNGLQPDVRQRFKDVVGLTWSRNQDPALQTVPMRRSPPANGVTATIQDRAAPASWQHPSQVTPDPRAVGR